MSLIEKLMRYRSYLEERRLHPPPGRPEDHPEHGPEYFELDSDTNRLLARQVKDDVEKGCLKCKSAT